MNNRYLLRQLAFVIILLTFASLSLAQNQAVSQKPPLTLSVTREAEGVYVMSSGAVSDFVFELFLVSGERVLASEPVSSERLQLRLQNAQGNPLAEGQYLYIGTSKIPAGTLVKYFGRLILQSGQAEMEDSSVVLGSYEKHYFAQCAFAAQSEAKQEDIDQQFSAFQQQEADNARAWRLKSATTNCASAAPTRSLAWYSLAAENWQCANAITERYTDQKRAMYSDPWYYRQISSAADQAKFDTCLAHG